MSDNPTAPASVTEPVSFDYGMWSAAGGAALGGVLDAVRAVLDSGLGRTAALRVLLGGCVQLEAEHPEYSDTVVRESIRFALTDSCEQAQVEPFTDLEIGDVSRLLSERGVSGYTAGYTLRFGQEDQLVG